MNVICGVNGEPWNDSNPLYVCHHCGMPVCARDGWTIAADDAFDDSNAPVSRAAMHCPRCADEYHRGVTRHHGWTDPELVQVTARAAAPSAAAYGGPAQAKAAGRA